MECGTFSLFTTFFCFPCHPPAAAAPWLPWRWYLLLTSSQRRQARGEPLRKLAICPLEMGAWVHEHSHELSHEAKGPAVGWWSNVTPNFEHLNRGTFKRHASGWDALSSGRRKSSQQTSLLQTQKKHPPPQERE